MKHRTTVAYSLSIVSAAGAAALAFVAAPLAAGLAAFAGVASGAAVVLGAVDRRHAERACEAKLNEADQRFAKREDALKSNVAALEREATGLRTDSESVRTARRRLAEAVDLVRETAPIIAGLAAKAIEKSERGSTSLTEDIYELGRQSAALGGTIAEFLTEMSVGDQSLEHNIGELTTDAHRLSDVAKIHDEASTSLDRSLTSIAQSVSETSELLGQVSDIAEQTSILAINAAIYAAKAGEFGHGFSVIATEIQKLAVMAKQVAETIGTNTDMIERQVGDFANTQRGLMAESQESLNETIESIRRTIGQLDPKVERISGSIHSAAAVSESVTNRLNEINVAMQEQDAIQQIVSHIAAILQEALEHAPARDDSGEPPADPRQLRELARSIAVRHFTMRDEYIAVGHDGYDEAERAAAQLADGTRLEGDVTLF